MNRALPKLIRLAKAQVDDRRRILVDLIRQADDLEAAVRRHDKERKAEADVASSGEATVAFAWSGFAEAARLRRVELVQAREALSERIGAAQEALAEAYKERRTLETIADRERERQAQEADRRAQAELDELALQRHQPAGSV